MKARAPLLALALLALGLGISLVQPLLPKDGTGDPQAFVEAVRARAGELEPGDTVLVHPPWRDDVVAALDEARLLPKGASATVALALPHGQAPGRVLLVVDEGAPPLPRAHRGRLHGQERSGGLVTGWLQRGEAGGELDLGARVALARVHVEKADGSVVRCRWNEGRDRHTCPGLPDWMYVGMDSVSIGGSPTRCVWSHPISKGKVVVRFDDLALGKELRFSHGLSDTAAATARGASVTASIGIDDKQVLRSVRTNAPGLKSEVLQVPSPGRSLTLEITAPDDGARHYCWTLVSDLSRGGTP